VRQFEVHTLEVLGIEGVVSIYICLGGSLKTDLSLKFSGLFKIRPDSPFFVAL